MGELMNNTDTSRFSMFDVDVFVCLPKSLAFVRSMSGKPNIAFETKHFDGFDGAISY